MDAANILAFLQELDSHNNRDWFMANKDWYTACQTDFEQFTAEWIAAMQTIDPTLRGLEAKQCIWRIYRDLRFERNRMRPYKEWMGAFLAAGGGRKSPRGGYYFHMQGSHCLFSAGIWCPSPALLKALRQSIYDNAEEVEEIMANKIFTQYFSDFDRDETTLKNAPAGYPRDWEHADWLCRKSFTITCPIPREKVLDPAFLHKTLLPMAAAAKPMNDFLNYTFEELP